MFDIQIFGWKMSAFKILNTKGELPIHLIRGKCDFIVSPFYDVISLQPFPILLRKN